MSKSKILPNNTQIKKEVTRMKIDIRELSQNQFEWTVSKRNMTTLEETVLGIGTDRTLDIAFKEAKHLWYSQV